MLLLTPARYRTMGFGADLSDIEDAELTMQLSVATRLANRFCSLPADYDFRGGAVVDEPHVWRLGNVHVRGNDRLFPFNPPLTQVDAFNIWVTNTQYLNVAIDHIFYDKTLNRLEPVIAATSIGVWSYSAIPVAGFREPIAKISYHYGYEFPVTDEVLFPEGGSRFRATNQWWTDDDVEVKKNGVVVISSAYIVDRDEGTITFQDPPDDLPHTDDDGNEIDVDVSMYVVGEGDIVTASYTHKVPEDVAMAVGVITTDLLGSRNVVGAGLLGLSGIKAEEIELRMARDQRITSGDISDRAQALLTPYKRLIWG